MKYTTVVADPPWPIEWVGGGAYRTNGRGEKHLNAKFKAPLPYSTLSINDICAFRVIDFVASDAHLYLWAPDKFLISGDAARVAIAWGFKPLRLFVWAKNGFALGRFPRPQHEQALICRRGNLAFRVNNVGSVQTWKMPYARSGRSFARVHSRKPDEFLDLVERASPGPYLELFARRNRRGWAAWGNECHSENLDMTGVFL
ncbi:MAG: MT-A70 family methyltransferase [Deltaproteobacteria bacterium]|nr:MT-A70 family methyltransferase [Deltaproteobacteria bacterium]